MDWLQVITNVGFPIAAFLMVYWDLRKLVIMQSEAIQKLVIMLEQHLINDNRRRR